MTKLFEQSVPVYVCKGCGLTTCDPTWDEGTAYCPFSDCGRELGAPATYRDARYVTIAVYEVSRQYGGPEEGGWYYDAGTLVAGTQRSFTDEDAPQAAVYLNSMLHRYRSDDRIRWSDQTNYHVRVWTEEDAPKQFPKERPYYH